MKFGYKCKLHSIILYYVGAGRDNGTPLKTYKILTAVYKDNVELAVSADSVQVVL